MKNCLILIVEDDQDAIGTWERDIDDFNDDRPVDTFKYEPIFARTREAALQLLHRTRINCAVIDLRLPLTGETDDSTSNASGNDVLEKLLIEAGVPAIVYSGHIAEASDLVKNSNIEIRSKQGNGGAEILKRLSEYEGLMAAMEITRKKIAIESARIFNDSIWKRWEASWKIMSDRDVLAGIITRQIASHVSDRLSLPPSSHHPEEFYISPPLFADRLDTGDMLVNDEEVFVVVTPRCNMANGAYPKYLTLALCKPMAGEWSSLRERFDTGDAKKMKSATAELDKYATQGHSTSTHFIPPFDEKGPWLVDFRETKSVLSSAAPDLLTGRFVSIATHFIPNLVQRYSAYLGRIGQPDIDPYNLRLHICRK